MLARIEIKPTLNLLTVKQAAAALGVSDVTIYRWLNRDGMPHHHEYRSEQTGWRRRRRRVVVLDIEALRKHATLMGVAGAREKLNSSLLRQA